MKNLTHILATLIFLTVILACSQGTKPETNKTDTKPTETKTPETKPTDAKSDTNKSNTNDSTTLSTPNPSSSSDIDGNYTVNGAGLDGKKYEGELSVTKRDAVYQFSWKFGATNYDGVGVQDGNNIAVAYSSGAEGKGCGAVIYKINNATDSLDGKWGVWGVNQSGTEKATVIGKPEGDTGNFDVTGTNADGSAYKGKLKITKSSEDIFQFAWDTGKKYIGTGIKMGDYLAAGTGSKQCGFVIYQIKNGVLEGKWGIPGTTKLGMETDTKK